MQLFVLRYSLFLGKVRPHYAVQLGFFFTDQVSEGLPLCFVNLLRKHLAKTLDIETSETA